MAIQQTEKIWHNGKLIPWDSATIHVMSHVIHYGSSVFEGVRCYALPGGPAIFRAKEHMQRLLDSAKIYRIDVDYTVDELIAGMSDLVKNNGAWPCYIRPIILRGYGEAGVNPLNSPTEVYICNYPWGNSVLPGITRESVLQIARDLGIPVTEQGIPRELLYIADEVFFTGTAAEVTPIRSVDKISVGKGTVGPITKAIQKEFYAIVKGEKADRHQWLTPVAVRNKQPVSV